MSFKPRDYLRHVLVEADYLIGQGAGLSFDDFQQMVSLRAFVSSWLHLEVDALHSATLNASSSPG
jgi:hypothetical protein